MHHNAISSQRAEAGPAHEPGENGSLLPVAGILDIVDDHAVVRADGYLAGPHDAHVPLALVRGHGLRRGDTVTGRARPAGRGQQLAPLVQVDTVNGQHPRHACARPRFSELVPRYPNERMRLETEPHALTTRVVDLIMPVGKGQRALIVAPPKAGKTSVLQAIAHGISKNHPKRFLGAARNIENGGSLTIFATALVETGSVGDTLIFEEYKGTSNAELRLDRKIAGKRVYPAVDVSQSSTRKEELLLSAGEREATHALRRALDGRDIHQAIDMLLEVLRKTHTNTKFLTQLTKTTPRNGNGPRTPGR